LIQLQPAFVAAPTLMSAYKTHVNRSEVAIVHVLSARPTLQWTRRGHDRLDRERCQTSQQCTAARGRAADHEWKSATEAWGSPSVRFDPTNSAWVVYTLEYHW